MRISDWSSDVCSSDLRDVDVGRVRDAIRADFLRAPVDRLGNALRRRATGGDVVLEAEVALRAAGSVAGRENEADVGLARADNGEGRRRRRDAVRASMDGSSDGKECGGTVKIWGYEV